MACPAIIAHGLAAELDDKQRYRAIARSYTCVADFVQGKKPDIASADKSADDLWEKIRPREVDPVTALENSEQVFAVSRPPGTRRSTIEFHVAVSGRGKAVREMPDLTGAPLYIQEKPFITTTDIVSVDVMPDSSFRYSSIVLHYSPSAALRLKNITTTSPIGKMAMLVDGKLFTVLNWFVPLESASMFSNSYTRREAMRLAQSFAP